MLKGAKLKDLVRAKVSGQDQEEMRLIPGEAFSPDISTVGEPVK